MSRISKLLTGIMVATVAVAVVAVPVKADAASDGLNAGLAYLQKIAEQSAVDKASVEKAAADGMAMAIAHQNDIQAAADAGMASGQAYLDSINAKTIADAAWVQAQAAAGIH